MLDKAANQPVKLPDTVDVRLPALIPESELYLQAESDRALLAAKRESVRAAQSRLDLAKRDYLPDFTVAAAYSVRDNSLSGERRADFLSMKLSVSVPIFWARKQARAVDQHTSDLMQQKYILQDEWNRVRGQISEAYSDYQRAKDQFILFKTGIVPQSRQTVASMLSGYQVSKADFLNLVRSQITLFNYELQYWQAFTQAKQALAQLTAVVGKEEIYE